MPKAVKTQPKTKVCISCGDGRIEKPLSAFYPSNSMFHADGLCPMCKDCVMEMSYDFLNHAMDMKSFMGVLRQIDRPYIPSVLEEANAQFDETYKDQRTRTQMRLREGQRVVDMYMKIIIGSNAYSKFNYEDGVTKLDDEDFRIAKLPTANIEEIEKEENKIAVAKKRFGVGFSDDDYETLNNEYEDWCDSLGGEPDDKSQREIIKNLCYAKLSTIRGTIEGNNISQIISSFNNSLTTGNLKPKEKSAMDSNSLGCIIRDIVKYAPAEFYADKLRHDDVEHYGEYIDRFILRPMRNTMLGEKEEDKEFFITGDDDG